MSKRKYLKNLEHAFCFVKDISFAFRDVQLFFQLGIAKFTGEAK